MRCEVFFSKWHASWAWLIIDGVSGEQIDCGWAESEEAARAKGAEWLRLDCLEKGAA